MAMRDHEYIGSIPPMILEIAHPAIYAAISAGNPLTKAMGDELKRSPWVIKYEEVAEYDE